MSFQWSVNNFDFTALNMSDFVPMKVYLRGILLHDFIQKKAAAEAHRILGETYSFGNNMQK